MTTTILHSAEDVAAMFGPGVSARQILDWRREYGWPAVKVGKTIRFTDAQVELILSRHTVEPKRLDTVLSGQTPRSAAASRRSA